MTQAQKNSFANMIKTAKTPVLVDFWAPWCGPCKMMAPALTTIAREYEGRLKVIKINVDENPQISQHYEISSIPTLMLFKEGKIVSRQAGAMAEPQLRQWLQGRV